MWLIFAKFAFGNQQRRHSYLQIEAIGREIVRQCHGLPVAKKNTWSSVPLYVVQVEE